MSVFTRLIDCNIGSLKEKVNAVKEAVAFVVAAERNERSGTIFIGVVDVDFFFVLHQLTEANELSLVQSLAAAQMNQLIFFLFK